jgi:hypothetical protein
MKIKMKIKMKMKERVKPVKPLKPVKPEKAQLHTSYSPTTLTLFTETLAKVKYRPPLTVFFSTSPHFNL